MSHKNLIKQLKKVKNLETVGRPEASWTSDSREILMHQINPQNKAVEYSPIKYYAEFFSSTLQQKFLRPALVALMVVSTFFTYSAFTLAAKASLPGEALYPVKVFSEKIQLVAAIGNEAKVKLQLDFISRRGDELQQIARQPEDAKAKSAKISQTVKQITEDVKNIQDKVDKIAVSSPATTVISTAKVVDDKTLKVEKDIVDAHTVLSTEVKKDVAKDVKEAIATTEEAGTKALLMMVAKSEEKQVKDNNQAVPTKEIAARVQERIKNTEAAVEVAADEVNKIATGTPAILNLVVLSSDGTNRISGVSSTEANTTTTLKDAVQDVTEKPKQAQEVIEQAKQMLDKNDVVSALQKIVESKNIAADALEKAPLINDKIQTEITSSTVSVVTATSTVK
ncbi:MAG: DUF5667 domain-containing protein [Patescibacteria group bacterium]